eukprot:2622659-Heterocapsa_arctica.AAC.1
MEKSRVIHLKIKGQAIAIKVKDPTTEWDLRMHAALKDAALGAEGGLPPLLHEQWLMDFKATTACTVPKIRLAPMLAARACATEILKNTELECFGDLQKVFIKYRMV